jgi:hypothetical protein
MIPDHLADKTAGSGRPPSRRALSRRSFLQAGAAAGGGLMLSLRMPFANGEAEAATADGFAPNAFIRIEHDGAGEGQRNGGLWHRRPAPGHEGRDPCAIACFRRSPEERG